MAILGLAESFKTVNRAGPSWPDPVRPWRYLTAYFLESIKEMGVKFWHNLDLSLQLKSEMDMVDGLETMRFSAS